MYKMLIVDDEKTERECIRYLACDNGPALELQEAADAADALMILKDWPADILFTDVQMPGMNGLDLIREALKIRPELKIIIFSSYAEFEYARTAMTLGAENYLLKPVVPEELTRILHSLVRQLDEACRSREDQNTAQTWLLRYALQRAINGNPVSSLSGIDFTEQLQRFSLLVFAEFTEPFLEKNYALFYEGLKNNLGADLEILNLSPRQALLFVQDSVGDANLFGQQLLSCITSSFGTECYLSVSRPLQEYPSLREAYMSVEAQMEQRFWNPSEKIITPFPAPRTESIPESTDDDSLLKLIRRDLSAKDAQGLLRHLGLLFDKYKSPSSQSQIFVKFVFSNLITSLYPYLPPQTEGNGCFKAVDELITELYLQPDIEEIIHTVQQMADRITASYEQPSPILRREVLTVQDYILKNYNKDLSVEMLASMVYLTPDYLSRLFKKSMDKSISQYIRQVRMEKASELLHTTNRKVIDIGIEAGYPNYSYFCQSFREYFGKSPEKYRQEEPYETAEQTL